MDTVFKNLRRAGTLKNRSLTIIVVPRGPPVRRHSSSAPPRSFRDVARSSPGVRVRSSNSETEAMLGSASPRNPSVWRLLKSDAARILLVAWRFRARRALFSLIPVPLSATRIYSVPPSNTVTSTLSAPASSEFSTSSFTTDAGFSTTSPAAIWFDVFVSRRRTSASCIGTPFLQSLLLFRFLLQAEQGIHGFDGRHAHDIQGQQFLRQGIGEEGPHGLLFPRGRG